jgi:hypothetical protein
MAGTGVQHLDLLSGRMDMVDTVGGRTPTRTLSARRVTAELLVDGSGAAGAGSPGTGVDPDVVIIGGSPTRNVLAVSRICRVDAQFRSS